MMDIGSLWKRLECCKRGYLSALASVSRILLTWNLVVLVEHRDVVGEMAIFTNSHKR